MVKRTARRLAAACIPVLLAGGVMGQERVTVSIDATTCRLLERHVPAPDVAYRPGVDVHGEPVVPADLHPRIEVPRRLAFEITIDPFDDSGRLAPEPGFAGSRFESTEIPVGGVSVDTLTGEITYEGRILQPADRQALVLACRDRAG